LYQARVQYVSKRLVSQRGTTMTMTALPTDPTELSAGPSRVDIAALHLSINQTWESGSSQNIHLLENGDIGAMLSKGQPKRNQIPCDAERGTIVIALNVDEDHDEVHYSKVAFRGEAWSC